MTDCCNFHGCDAQTPPHIVTGLKVKHSYCNDLVSRQKWKIDGKGRPWLDAIRINHYSRSLEKFELKSKTWNTASGEVRKGQTQQEAASGYNLATFFSRSVGWAIDRTALRYSCQVREYLRNVTGLPRFYRPGNHWYRNPEFGRPVSDERKRGRYGRSKGDHFHWQDGNPFHYHLGKPQGSTLDTTLPLFPKRNTLLQQSEG